MTTNVGTTKLILITVACFVFAATCAVVVWKMKPAETKSETEVHRLHKGDDVNFAMLWAGGESGCISDTAWTEIESWTESSLINEFKQDQYQVFRDSSNSGRRLEGKAPKAYFVPVAKRQIALASTGIEAYLAQREAQHEAYLAQREAQREAYLAQREAALAQQEAYLAQVLGDLQAQIEKQDQIEEQLALAQAQYISANIRGGSRILESLDDLILQEISGMAPLVVNVGHGYEDHATGVSFSYLQSHDPDCDTSQIYLTVF